VMDSIIVLRKYIQIIHSIWWIVNIDNWVIILHLKEVLLQHVRRCHIADYI
jgi:hypothetical protein